MMHTNINDLQEQLARVCAERDRYRAALVLIAEEDSWIEVDTVHRTEDTYYGDFGTIAVEALIDV